jgi:DNA repair protein RadD
VFQDRQYQTEAVDSVFNYFAGHQDPSQNCVIAMPTGTGKSVVIARFCERTLKSWPNQRIMIATHVKELVKQNSDKLRTLWRTAPLGIYSAGLKQKDMRAPITFAGVQSVVKAVAEFSWIDILIIDECHLLSEKDTGSYKVLITALRKVNPGLRVIGLSATPYRLGLGMITDGGIFTDICYDITGLNAFVRLLDEGYLCPLIPQETKEVLPTDGIRIRAGEFRAEDLHAKVVRRDITKRALEEAWDRAGHRHHWLIFGVDIEHVEMINEILSEMGISSRMVHSKIGDDRDKNINAFLNGEVKALVNADILTTGFDFPALDCIILLRPTNSVVLHVQIMGRGTRPFYADGFDLNETEGRLAAIAASYKQNCLILDFAGNTKRLGPINDPKIPKKRGEGGGDVPIKTCNECGVMHHISARFCDNCGAEFPIQEKITQFASTAQLIVRDDPIVETYKVDRVTYAPHVTGKGTSIKVSYYSGLNRYTEYVCIGYEGPIRRRAEGWWQKRSPWEFPPGVKEALMAVDSLKVPTHIRVHVNKRYPEIISHIFEEEHENAV